MFELKTMNLTLLGTRYTVDYVLDEGTQTTQFQEARNLGNNPVEISEARVHKAEQWLALHHGFIGTMDEVTNNRCEYLVRSDQTAYEALRENHDIHQDLDIHVFDPVTGLFRIRGRRDQAVKLLAFIKETCLTMGVLRDL